MFVEIYNLRRKHNNNINLGVVNFGVTKLNLFFD